MIKVLVVVILPIILVCILSRRLMDQAVTGQDYAIQTNELHEAEFFVRNPNS
jgi:hypothetical protein